MLSLCLFVADDLFPELTGGDAVDEGFDAVDGYYGDVVPVFAQQRLIRFDIDLLQNKLITTSGAEDRGLRLVTKVTPGTGINDDMRHGHRYFLPAVREIRYK